MASSRVGNDACLLSRRWRISPTLAGMLVALDARAESVFSSQGLRWPGLYVISGYRSPSLQASVNPTEPFSGHVECPAVAVDLRVGDLPASTTPEFWPVLGTLWKAQGGRWGGDFPTPDPNHFEELTVRGGPVAVAPLFSRLTSRLEVTPILVAPKRRPTPVTRTLAPPPPIPRRLLF